MSGLNDDFNQATAMIQRLQNTCLSNRISLLPIAVLMTSLLALSGCATTLPEPRQSLQAAEIAINNAERDHASEFAALELSEARTKLAAAHDAVKKEEMVQANRLAEQSLADAELASRKAELARAKIVNDGMQESIDILQQEMQRNNGAR